MVFWPSTPHNFKKNISRFQQEQLQKGRLKHKQKNFCPCISWSNQNPKFTTSRVTSPLFNLFSKFFKQHIPWVEKIQHLQSSGSLVVKFHDSPNKHRSSLQVQDSNRRLRRPRMERSIPWQRRIRWGFLWGKKCQFRKMCFFHADGSHRFSEMKMKSKCASHIVHTSRLSSWFSVYVPNCDRVNKAHSVPKKSWTLPSAQALRLTEVAPWSRGGVVEDEAGELQNKARWTTKFSFPISVLKNEISI